MTQSIRPRACCKGLHTDTEPRGPRAFPRTGWRSCCWLPGAGRVWRGRLRFWLLPAPGPAASPPETSPLAYPAPPRRLSTGRADPVPGWERHREGAQRVTFVQTCAFPAHQASRPRGLVVPCNKQGLPSLALEPAALSRPATLTSSSQGRNQAHPGSCWGAQGS